MERVRRVVESLYVRLGAIVAGIPLIAGAVIGRWPNPWSAIAVAAGAILIVLAAMGFVLDLMPKAGPEPTATPTAPPRLIELRPFVVWSPQPGGRYKPRLHLEAVNIGERTLSLAQWTAAQHGGPTVAGSPYEGRAEGPDLLQPTQLHGWDIPLDTPGGVFGSETPITVTVRLTTGELFMTEPISLRPPVPQ